MGAYTHSHRPRFHLTLEEAAGRFGVSTQTLVAGIRRRELRAKRLAHRSWVLPAAVARFLAQNTALGATTRPDGGHAVPLAARHAAA